MSSRMSWANEYSPSSGGVELRRDHLSRCITICTEERMSNTEAFIRIIDSLLIDYTGENA